MALKTDEILDATSKGNFSRFINHSCNPNCETQKWTVNGELRVGVFSKRMVCAGEEFTLDYQFQRYGREAQKCFCESDNCSGFIGGEKQLSIDAYSATKSNSSTKKKKGVDDKKREWEDITLEEEIEKLNASKGLRNREETLKFARLMVRADDTVTRHRLLDIIIKTEEQACLRLFLDYHGLPLLWSWMTDVVDLELKEKILHLLGLLPISNKTMLLDSKVISVVEKWVQDSDTLKKTPIAAKVLSSNTAETSAEDNTEPHIKKLKISEFSDSESDSTGSHNANETSSDNTAASDSNFKEAAASNEAGQKGSASDDIVLEDTESKAEADAYDKNLKSTVSSKGICLLLNWKNLKEVFRIPRLEQQKRKEDELRADCRVLENVKVENVAQPKSEPTGDHIQVHISGKTPSFSDNLRAFEYDSPERFDSDRSRNVVLPNLQVLSKLPSRRHGYEKPKMESNLRKINEDGSSNIGMPHMMMKGSSRHMVLPGSGFISNSNLSCPPSIQPHLEGSLSLLDSSTASMQHLDTAPQAVFPPSMSFPPPTQLSQAPYLNTGHLPLTSIPPLSGVVPQTLPSMCQPGISSNPPINPNGIPVNPPGYLIPPISVTPTGSQFMTRQGPVPANYPPTVPFGGQGQPFYLYQQPPTMPSSTAQSTFTEDACVQSTAALPLLSPNTLPSSTSALRVSTSAMPLQLSPVATVQSKAFLTHQSSEHVPFQSSEHVPFQSSEPVPFQSSEHAPFQSSEHVPFQSSEHVPFQSSDHAPFQSLCSPVEEEPKPVKLPKNWRSATDGEGNVYYYHSITRVTQWDPPDTDQVDEEDSDEDEEDSDSEESESSDTPTYDEPKISTKHSRHKTKKKKTTKAAADTSVSFPVRPEVAKKIKELFRTKMSTYIVHCLNSYRKPDCTTGRITSNEDFKYLARKLTHYTMTKELKQCKNVEDLDCNETVMHKARDFIKKYMSKYGSKYSRKEKISPQDT